MKICFISPEIFSWGIYGGFGYLTRLLGSKLASRGHEVSVVTERRDNQEKIEILDGITVYGYPSFKRKRILPAAPLARIASSNYYRCTDADIFHSQAVSYNSLIAQKVVKEKTHIITLQDPYDYREWQKISKVDPSYRINTAFKCRMMLDRRLLSSACKNAQALYVQARFLARKAKHLFNLDELPPFLPNPVVVPSRRMRKADEPTVCFLGRWDPQKRVELFFRLAEQHPDIKFIAMGRSHDQSKDLELRRRYGSIRNLFCTGFVSEEEKSAILERSWALVNTSVREALPISFLEALAHETPILSSENPDSLTSLYGCWVPDENYRAGLEKILDDESRLEKGRLGRRYVAETHEVEKVVDRHLEIYENLLESRL